MDLDEDWLALGVEPLPENWRAPSVSRLRRWVETLGSTPPVYLTVKAPNPTCRQIIYRQMGFCPPLKVKVEAASASWKTTTFVEDLARRLDLGTLLQGLVEVPSLLVDEPLSITLDKDRALLSAFDGLWSARFDFWEGRSQEEVSRALTDLIGPPANANLDEILLWLTLARQNGILDRYVLPIDGLGGKLIVERQEELSKLILLVSAWVRLGGPLGLVFGIDEKEVSSLGSTQLGQRLLQALV